MKKVTSVLVAISLVVLFQTSTLAQAENKEIEKVVYAYRDALNASDVNKVISLYTQTGVLLPNAAPIAVGTDQIKGTYQYVFDNFKYTLEFAIGEITVSGNHASATSTSKGAFVIKSSGQNVPDENRELFVFEKVNGQWKIARYMYNKYK